MSFQNTYISSPANTKTLVSHSSSLQITFVPWVGDLWQGKRGVIFPHSFPSPDESFRCCWEDKGHKSQLIQLTITVVIWPSRVMSYTDTPLQVLAPKSLPSFSFSEVIFFSQMALARIYQVGSSLLTSAKSTFVPQKVYLSSSKC